jgi:hypothetical protein
MPSLGCGTTGQLQFTNTALPHLRSSPTMEELSLGPDHEFLLAQSLSPHLFDSADQAIVEVRKVNITPYQASEI